MRIMTHKQPEPHRIFMRSVLIVSLIAVLTLSLGSPARALSLNPEGGATSREPGAIVLNEFLLAAVSGMAVFSPKVYGGLLVVSAPVVHFSSGKDAPPLLRWGMPLFYLTLGVYNMTVLEDNSTEEARIFRENFAAWNGLYIYALTHNSEPAGGKPVSAGVTALPGRVFLTTSLHF